MSRRKERICRCCGAKMPRDRLWICADCQSIGASVSRPTSVNGREILDVARSREGLYYPLDGMKAEEINEVARLFHSPYNSYGKLRAYADATGRMPGPEFERKD